MGRPAGGQAWLFYSGQHHRLNLEAACWSGILIGFLNEVEKIDRPAGGWAPLFHSGQHRCLKLEAACRSIPNWIEMAAGCYVVIVFL